MKKRLRGYLMHTAGAAALTQQMILIHPKKGTAVVTLNSRDYPAGAIVTLSNGEVVQVDPS
jgi:hypothetical protein